MKNFLLIFVVIAATYMFYSCKNKQSDRELQHQLIEARYQHQIDSLKLLAAKVSAETPDRHQPEHYRTHSTSVRNHPSDIDYDYLFYMVGRIGGDSNCTLYCQGNEGYYTFINYQRDLRYSSYNSSNGKLILEAYEQGTGKYIGEFNGNITGPSTGSYRYKGTFTNYKGGQVTFDLKEAPWD